MMPRQTRTKELIRGLYAITDGALMPEAEFVDRAERALRGGARILQYRDKSAERDKRIRQAIGLLSVCRQYGTPLIINDDAELAQRIGAPGVHIGQEDISVQDARTLLGPEAIIGVSCHDSLELAINAQLAGADYVAFGAFQPSATKPGTPLAGPELLRRAKKRLALPVVAIGGITPENGGFLIRAGADALAVIQGVFGSADVEANAQRYARLFRAPGGRAS